MVISLCHLKTTNGLKCARSDLRVPKIQKFSRGHAPRPRGDAVAHSPFTPQKIYNSKDNIHRQRRHMTKASLHTKSRIFIISLIAHVSC